MLDEAPGVSTVDVPTIGQHGIRRKFIDTPGNDILGWGNIVNHDLADHPDWIVTEEVGMHLEAPYNNGENVGNHYKGWFVPPLSGRYRFYISCDDDCKLLFKN